MVVFDKIPHLGSQIPQRRPGFVHWREGQMGQRIRDRGYEAPTRGGVRTTEPSQSWMVDLRRKQSQRRPGEEVWIQGRRSATRPGFLQQPVSRQRRSRPIEEPVRQATPQLVNRSFSVKTLRSIA